jgi:hypothetical protein
MKYLLIIILLLAGCPRTHAPAGAIEVSDEDCVTCHLGDYEAADDPVHVGMMPTTCDDCHSTHAWRPASGLHPESQFPIQSGPHEGVDCSSCHEPERGPYQEGANTNCLSCHPNSADLRDEHDDEPFFYDTSRPNFCLDCHPRGLADD